MGFTLGWLARDSARLIVGSISDTSLSRLDTSISLVGLVGAFIGGAVAAYGVYSQFLRPAELRLLCRRFAWHAYGHKTQGDKPLGEIVLWLSVENSGALSGVVEDLRCVIEWAAPAKGATADQANQPWELKPAFLLDSEVYLRTTLGADSGSRDGTSSPSRAAVIEPFGPFLVPGRDLVTKCVVLWTTRAGKQALHAGSHVLRVFASIGGDERELGKSRKLIVQQADVEAFAAGSSVAGVMAGD